MKNSYAGIVNCITCSRALVHDIDKLARNLLPDEFLSIAYVDNVCDFCDIILAGQCRLCYKAEGDEKVKKQFNKVHIEHSKEFHSSVNLT